MIALALMLVGHAIADGLLQPHPLSQLKRSPVLKTRLQALALHGAAHGFFVTLATGSPILGLAELVAHAGIDRMKGKGWIGTETDQILHVLCKVVWCAVLIWC